jgi:hypothetical protein
MLIESHYLNLIEDNEFIVEVKEEIIVLFKIDENNY